MKYSSLLYSASSAIVLTALCAGTAFAQAQDAGASTGQEIVITAEKTSGVASKTPIALSVYSGQDLQQQGIVDINSLQQVAPGLQVGSASHGASITIRGVTTTDVTSKGDQDIVFSVDGIPIGRPQEMELAFFDLDRVEVLRGPQGTLYGKSSTAGAINVITAKPKDAFDASASVELGNYDTRRGTAMINMPVTDNFAVRVAGNFNMRDGFLTPTLGVPQAAPNTEAPRAAEDNWTTRITALWKITDGASLTLTGTFGHIGGPDESADAIYNRVLNYKGAGRFDIYYNPMVGASGDDDDFANYNAELNWDLGPVHLAYDGARLTWIGDDDFDPQTDDPAGAGGTPSYSWNQYHSNLVTDSHEVRLSNARPGRLDWVVGANYWREYNDETDLNWQTVNGPNNGVNCVAPTLAPACTNPNPDIVGPTEHQTEAVFGQGNYHVNDQLKLTLGLRYTSDSMYRRATVAAGGAPPGGFLTASGAPCGPPNACVGPASAVLDDDGSEASSKVTWRVGAEYQLNPADMVYASVATGYKAGGFNDYEPTAHGTGAYGPEAVTAYELGYKGRLMDNLRLSSDVYYYDYQKYQLTGATFLTPSATGGSLVGVIIYTSLAPATMYGWENEATWTPTPNDTFDVSFTLARAYFNPGANAAHVGFIFTDQVNWGGKSLDNMPTAAATVSYEHRWILPNQARINARVSSKLSSSYYESNLGGNGNPFAGTYSLLPTQYTQPAYTRTDLLVGYTTANGKYNIEGFVQNIEDGVQILSAPTTPGVTADSSQVRISLPRTFGVRFNLKY